MSEQGPNYHAKAVERIDHGKGHWETVRVGVFRGGEQIGEYERNYPGFAGTTFFPFEQSGRWFALYSRHYTATRVMSLPDCADLGGEEPAAGGFCPVEYLVPELTGQVLDPADPKPLVANHDDETWAHKVPLEGGGTRFYWPDNADHPCPDEAKKEAYLKARDESHAAWKAWLKRNPFVTRFAPWGFVAGCHWGDDSSMKLQFLDLSRAAEGIVKRDDRFGYFELPRGVSLKDAVDTGSIYVLNGAPEETVVTLATPVNFTLAGRRLED